MPVYEYRCTKCEKEFEYQQRMADPPMTVCEACGGELERLISRTAFQLKGGGWYKDLYSSSKRESKSEGAASSTSESKPAESAPKSDKPSGGGDGGGSGTASGSGSGSGTASGSGSGSAGGSGSTGGTSARPAAIA